VPRRASAMSRNKRGPGIAGADAAGETLRPRWRWQITPRPATPKRLCYPAPFGPLLRRPISALSMRYYSSAEVVARLHKLLAHSSRMQLAREAGVSDEYLRKILHAERSAGAEGAGVPRL
jgi:hypothetical protein